MTKVVMAIGGIREEGGWKVVRHAYMGELDEHERVKDMNYANHLLDTLFGGEGVETSWKVREEPPEDGEGGYKRFFDIVITIENHMKLGRAKYGVDYHKYAGCPSAAIEDGMAIYRTVKKDGVRRANKMEEVKVRVAKAKEEEARKERERLEGLRFAEGKIYSGTYTNEFGREIVKKVLVVRRNEEDGGKIRAHITVVGDIFDTYEGSETVKVFKRECDGCEYFKAMRGKMTVYATSVAVGEEEGKGGLRNHED